MKLGARSFLIGLFILILFGCSKNFSSSELEKHFTTVEIEDLNKINNFFITKFLKSDQKNFKEAFLSFKHRLVFKGQFSNNDELLFKKQLELYNSISKSTFDEIWEVGVTSGPPFPDETYMDGKTNGKYYSFLNELSESNAFAQSCYERIERTGDYNALHLDSYFHYNRDTFDYDDFHNQLILAIYYLTAIDASERDQKRKKRFEEFKEKAKLDFE
ncbi:hypothetical protein [Winogradskyella sp.]|uniref:hypothetical protein n=1 Tax=Winogradskyella sp. TaxID=1883156 RepID=UPI002627AB65|nr:hypothetical protein [Winogradskyella sp.]